MHRLSSIAAGIYLAATIVSAKPSLGVSADNSYFPIQTTRGGEGLTQFEAQWYSRFLEKMEEPPLPEFANNTTAQIYRILILPTWGNPICVQVQKHGDTYDLSARRLDGFAGYQVGALIESKRVQLDDTDSKALDALVSSASFFRLPSKEDKKWVGMDGDDWVLEGLSGGKYHVVSRWCASSYNSKKRGLKPFVALCKFLIDESTLSQRPENKGHKLI
jgi:hypothetical protein